MFTRLNLRQDCNIDIMKLANHISFFRGIAMTGQFDNINVITLA